VLVQSSFDLQEAYFSGMHTSSVSDAVDLTTVVRQTLESAGIQVYDLVMTETGTSTAYVTDDTVHWTVYLTVPQNEFADLETYHGSSAFVSSLVSAAHALGGLHASSVFSTNGPIAAGATSAPSPPTP
tara:strand:+ start:203 stop:586 length:384 start_codon:yes stop_codon:yes gene_type:complete